MAELTADERKHKLRVERELRTAGVSERAMKRFSQRNLHPIVQQNEHIAAVAYGRYRDAEKLPAWDEGMLIATNYRILFLDRKPSYMRLEDIPYDSVAGVDTTKAGPSGSVTLYARGTVHALLYVPNRSREQFVHYLEERRLEDKSQ